MWMRNQRNKRPVDGRAAVAHVVGVGGVIVAFVGVDAGPVDSVAVVCLSQETCRCDSPTLDYVDLDKSVVFVFSYVTSVKVALSKHQR